MRLPTLCGKSSRDLRTIVKKARSRYHSPQVSLEVLMPATVREVLAAFDTLSPPEQRQVAAEILRRSAVQGDLPEAALHELAAELFRGYDARDARPPVDAVLVEMAADPQMRHELAQIAKEFAPAEMDGLEQP
jgi:hypothetical protein